METIATLLSGGEGVGIGTRAAGLSHLWGIEIDDAIAGVARDNDFNVITSDILEIDPHNLAAPDVLHASPECQNASNAKNSPDAKTLEEKETRGDVEIADAIVRYLEVLQPRIFTLENVYGYRRFQSFRKIMIALARLGYFSDVAHLNSADFGVPQTRKRLILRAVRGGLVPPLPAPEPWVGWYEAIEDLIPTLLESEFAPWQQARLPEVMQESWMIGSENAGQEWGGTKYGSQPAMTITTEQQPRAFVVGGQFGKPADGSGEPRPPQYKDQGEPIFTVTAVNKGDWRAWLSQGRVVKMTPLCLARFQSFPDSYRLPEKNGLACRVIGNAVPCLMYEKLVRQLIQA